MSTSDDLDAFVRFFERLSPATLDRLETIYAPDACFRDPFNEVRGVPAIRRIFEHMYRQVDEPAFHVSARFLNPDEAMLVWLFSFRFKGSRQIQQLEGTTRLRFDERGRVTLHRDYWDPAQGVYEKLPAIGAVARWLRARLSAGR